MKNTMINPSFLESILFCLPGLHALNGQNKHYSKLTTAIPASSIPSVGEFSSSLAHPKIDLKEVPFHFGISPEFSKPPWFPFPGSHLLNQCIQYQFSDQTTLTAHEILYHPYSAHVPPDLLPLLSNIKPELETNTWISLLPFLQLPYWGKLRQTELALLATLVNVPAYPHIRFFLTDTQDRNRARQAMRIQQVRYELNDHFQPQLRWHLVMPAHQADPHSSQGSAHLTFRSEPAQDLSQDLFQGFALQASTATLIFHPYQRMIEIALQTFKYPAIQELEQNWKSDSNTDLTLPLTHHTQIADLTSNLDRKLRLSQFGEIQKMTQLTLTAGQIQSEIWIHLNGSIQICRKFTVNQQKIAVWNLPPITTLILRGLTGGLGTQSLNSKKYTSPERNSIRRERDQKILKHTGIFAFILLEATCFIIKKKTSDGKPLSDLPSFFNHLWPRLSSLLMELERKSGFFETISTLSLEQFCTKNLIDFIQKYLTELIESCENHVEQIYLPAGEISLTGGDKTVLAIFYTILMKSATVSKGSCFLKPKLNTVNHFLGKKGELVLERICLDENEPHDFQQPVGQTYHLENPWIKASDVIHMLVPLRRMGIEIFYNSLSLNEMKAEDLRPEFELVEPDKQNTHIDWFELHPKFFFKGEEISSEAFEAFSRNGVMEFQGKIYLIPNKQVPSMRRLEAFWARIQKGSGDPKKRVDRTYLHVPRSRVLEMLALRASGVSVQGGERWQKICKFYDSLKDRNVDTPFTLPPTVKAELKPYQKTGTQWLLDLYELGLGGILADDMGLGKTLQTLTFLEQLRIQGHLGLVLIIVPTSLTYSWQSESARFTPLLPIQIFQSKTKDPLLNVLSKEKDFVLISTYGLFTEHLHFFEAVAWNILIFDEAQNLKNISTKRTTASRRIPARFKLCLTGTPLENHLGEFYSLLDLVVSGSLGDWKEFKNKFITPDIIDSAEMKFLKLRSKPLLLRRTKSEILTELPPKVESIIKLPFETKQERIYRDIALSWNAKIKESILDQGEAKSQLLMLTALLRLRQACSDPAAIPHVKYVEAPPKIVVLMDALEEITDSGESALVFTQFLHTFDRIKKELISRKISAFWIHGSTSRSERERTLKQFQESSKGSVLLMTLKTGGVGLNLVKASYVFHLEPWWNPAVENQASDRVHRLGQQKPVQVYRYLMKGSVEEKIEILKERKSARFNALFSTSEANSDFTLGSSHLTQTDFDYLLS